MATPEKFLEWVTNQAMPLVNAVNSIFGASGASHSVGLVPDPGSSSGTTRFLREDATWVQPNVVNLAGLNSVAGFGVGFCNKFINPGCDIDTANGGASVACGVNGQYVIDGWIVQPTGANCTGQQAAAQSGMLSSHGLLLTGAASVTDILTKQRIEGKCVAPLAGQVCTVQAKIFNNTGGSITPTLTLQHPTATDNYAGVVTDLGPVNFQACPNGQTTTVAYTFTAASGITAGLQVIIDFGNNFSSGSKTVTVSDTDVRITPGLTTGLQANPPLVELRPMSIEYTYCARYLQYGFFDLDGSAGAAGNGIAASNNFSVPMRAAPSISLSNLSALGVVSSANFAAISITATYFRGSLGSTSGSGGYIGNFNWLADARLF